MAAAHRLWRGDPETSASRRRVGATQGVLKDVGVRRGRDPTTQTERPHPPPARPPTTGGSRQPGLGQAGRARCPAAWDPAGVRYRPFVGAGPVRCHCGSHRPSVEYARLCRICPFVSNTPVCVVSNTPIYVEYARLSGGSWPLGSGCAGKESLIERRSQYTAREWATGMPDAPTVMAPPGTLPLRSEPCPRGG